MRGARDGSQCVTAREPWTAPEFYGPNSLMAAPSLKNGGSGAHYRWGQSAREVTIAINAGSRRGRDFRVEINRSRVSVAARSCGDEVAADAAVPAAHRPPSDRLSHRLPSGSTSCAASCSDPC